MSTWEVMGAPPAPYSTHRPYPRCSKGGHPKPADRNYVCGEHEGPGLYTHCAVCGTDLGETSRNYVCGDCLA